jgi:hypothetical protein
MTIRGKEAGPLTQAKACFGSGSAALLLAPF